MNKNAKKSKKLRAAANSHRARTTESPAKPANRGWWLSLLALPVMTVVVMWVWFKNQQTPQESNASRVDPILEVAELRSRLRRGDYQQVLSRCRDLLKDNPTDSSLLLISGEAASKLGEFQAAMSLYDQVPVSRTDDAAVAKWAVGEIQWHLGRPTACITSLAESVRLKPALLDAHERLVWMYTATGRRSEIVPHALELLRNNRGSFSLLLDLGNTRIFFPNWSEIERFRKSTPSDLLPNMALARKLVVEEKLDEAETLLTPLLEQQPELAAAHVLLAEIWQVTAPARLQEWKSAQSDLVRQSPDVLVAHGTWLELLNQQGAAIQCFGEAVVRNPNDPLAHLNLARLLRTLGETHESTIEALSERGLKLQQLEQAIDRIRLDQRYEPTVQQAAELCFQLSRIWEAIGWCSYGLELNQQASWPGELLARIRQSTQLSTAMPHTLAAGRLLDKADWLKNYRSADTGLETIAADDTKHEDGSIVPKDLAIEFEDIAASAGISFRYHNSQTDRSLGRRMFEITGGGVGVIDFDGDGREDFFLAQGTDWPPPTTPSTYSDTLYRHQGFGEAGIPRFSNCALNARIQEGSFGQGLSVADVDNDGFDDLYVANYHANQLWINQGDGTFITGNHWFPSDTAHHWTASTLAVDINADGSIDLIDINYVGGENVETMRCQIEGLPRSCPPLVFRRAPLVIWLGTASGSFIRQPTDPSAPPEYYGLGGVAFLAKSECTPTVFIAVDQQANGLLKFEQNEAGQLLVEDVALSSGVAFNRLGQAEACMGIAAGDLTGNGEIDLFVTNFHEETNTLYLQEQGLFSDQTLPSGLSAPSREMLGFGTQFVDCNLRGALDIVVLNGHIDDLTHTGVPEEMQPQLFVNQAGRFSEAQANEAGEFFSSPRLGRALAKIDVDSNGLLDFLVTDLEAPFSLLMNRSTPAANYLAINLVGVTSNRNGLLSTVTLAADEYSVTQQLLAGGGYMASNTRQLIFAIPTDMNRQAMTATVRWQHGAEETYGDLSVNQRHTLVEGTGQLPVAN